MLAPCNGIANQYLYNLRVNTNLHQLYHYTIFTTDTISVGGHCAIFIIDTVSVVVTSTHYTFQLYCPPGYYWCNPLGGTTNIAASHRIILLTSD